MKTKQKSGVFTAIRMAAAAHHLLTAGTILCVAASVAAADPAVLLLDEITANLDAETEARVLEALRRASEGRTVLSVSHRIYENLGGRTIEVRAQA